MDKSPYLDHWLNLSTDDRNHLAAHFRLKKSGVTSVLNNAAGSKILSDGYTVEDLKGISIVHMIEFLGADLSWYAEAQVGNLLQLCLQKIYGPKAKKGPEPVEQPKEESAEEEGTEKPKPKRRGRPAKKKEDL